MYICRCWGRVTFDSFAQWFHRVVSKLGSKFKRKEKFIEISFKSGCIDGRDEGRAGVYIEGEGQREELWFFVWL